MLSDKFANEISLNGESPSPLARSLYHTLVSTAPEKDPFLLFVALSLNLEQLLFPKPITSTQHTQVKLFSLVTPLSFHVYELHKLLAP